MLKQRNTSQERRKKGSQAETRTKAQAATKAQPANEPQQHDTKEPRELSKVGKVHSSSAIGKNLDEIGWTSVSTGLTSSADKPQYRRHFRRVTKFNPYTIFDSPEWHNSQFAGFYVLFWVIITVLTVRILLMNFLKTGRPLQTNIIGTLTEDLTHVALVDFVMYLCLYPVYFGQVLVAKGYINWSSWGWIAQHIYQAVFLGAFVGYARLQKLPWIAQIFLTLHALVQLMKMHSFAVFNGYMKTLEIKIAANKPKTDLERELIQQATDELEEYPANLTFRDFFMYTMYPTVVYETNYPRTDHIRWGYAFSKIAATLGIFVVMIVVAEQMMHPVAVWANRLRESGSLYERIEGYPLVFLNIFPPFVLLYLLTFYIIWDAILNSLAELTMYGDREFYRDWWNSTQWAKFARDWNVPVHNFLQRHVYSSSRLFLKLSRSQAMVFTFLLSSLVHELAMYVIFGRVRGYLLLMQLTQLPMQFISQIKFFRDRPRFGLVMFWFGIALGPSILCSLYLTF